MQELEGADCTGMKTPQTNSERLPAAAGSHPPAPERFTMGDNRRFHWRIYGCERGQRYEVYSIGLVQWAECTTPEHAAACADALEAMYENVSDETREE